MVKLIEIYIFYLSITCLIANYTDLNVCEYPHLNTALTDSQCDNVGSKAEVSKAIRAIFGPNRNYDIRMRPPNDKMHLGPVRVFVSLHVTSITEVSEVDMDYKMTMFFQQQWNDPRLSFEHLVRNKECPLTLDSRIAEQIWLPDTHFINDRRSFYHDVTTRNRLVRLWPNGTVLYSTRITLELACMMNLIRYPLDEQNCTLVIRSFGYTDRDIVFCKQGNIDQEIDDITTLKLQQFRIASSKWQRGKIKSSHTNPEANFDLMVLSIELSRALGYFVLQTYMPCLLITILSWVSFWINHEATAARVSLGITTVLTMTTISTNVRAGLPKIGDIKALDVYMLVSFAFVFMGLLEYALVNYLFFTRKDKILKKREKEKEKFKRIQKVIRKNKKIRFLSDPDFYDQVNQDLINISQKIHPFSISSTINNNQVKIPKIGNVEVIDQVARVVFPLSFFIFNVGYYFYYRYFYKYLYQNEFNDHYG